MTAPHQVALWVCTVPVQVGQAQGHASSVPPSPCVLNTLTCALNLPAHLLSWSPAHLQGAYTPLQRIDLCLQYLALCDKYPTPMRMVKVGLDRGQPLQGHVMQLLYTP
jgi:hypothetical protein